MCLIHFFICEGSNEALLCVCSGQWSNLVLIFLFWGSAFVFHKLSRHAQGHSKDKGWIGGGREGASTPSNTSCNLRIYMLCNIFLLNFWIKRWVGLVHVNVSWVVAVCCYIVAIVFWTWYFLNLSTKCQFTLHQQTANNGNRHFVRFFFRSVCYPCQCMLVFTCFRSLTRSIVWFWRSEEL